MLVTQISSLPTLRTKCLSIHCNQCAKCLKTGGAVGNVSDKEGDRLENAIVALQSSQTEKQFMVELANLRRVTVEGQQRLQNALQAEYGSRVQVDADASSLSDDDLFN